MAKTSSVKPQQWPTPSMGLFLELDPAHVPPNALVRAENLFYPFKGTLRSRAGFDTLHDLSAAGSVQGMYYWPEDDSLYWWDDSANLFKDGSEIAGGSISNNIQDVVAFGSNGTRKLYIAEAKGSQDHTIHTWDGSSYAQLTGDNIPAGEKLMVRFNQLWVTKVDGEPSHVYWSAYGDPTTFVSAWGGPGFNIISRGSHGDIVDWATYKDVLYFLKEQGIYAMLGDRDANFREKFIGDENGLQAGTVADCISGLLFATDRGVFPIGRRYKGEMHDLTRNIERDIQPLLASASAAFSQTYGSYLLTTGNNTVWVSNVQQRPDVWTRWTFRPKISCAYEGDKLYLGTTDGRILEHTPDSFDDDSLPYPVGIKTGFWDMGSRQVETEIDHVGGSMEASGQADVTASLLIDNKDIPERRTTKTFTSGDIALLKQKLIARTLAVELEYSQLSGPVYFTGLRLAGQGFGDVK